MSLRASVLATPTLMRVAFAEAVAYRTEMLIWILSTTMPLVMLSLFHAVASEGQFGRFGPKTFVAYYLATFVVRQISSSWAAWLINWDVKQGTLSVRLLRPVHPLWAYAVESVAGVPLRLLVALPVAGAALWLVGREVLPRDGVMWAIFGASLVGGWAIAYLTNVLIGSMSLWAESTIHLMDLYLVIFFVFSGYLIPVELFPAWVRHVADALPFRYQMGFPVEVLTNAHALPTALRMLTIQWAFAAGLLGLSLVAWRRGLRRYEAFGG